MTFEAWSDELQAKIERVIWLDGLAEFLLDHVDWESAYDGGRTPEQALSDVLAVLKRRPDVFARYVMRDGS